MSKLLLELLDEDFPDLVLFVIFLVVIALLGTGITANGADVDHAIAELDEGATLYGDIEIGNVVEDEFDEFFVRLLANPFYEAVAWQLDSQFVSCEAVLAETEIEHACNGATGGSELFLLLDEVGAANKADGALMAESLQGGQHLWGDVLVGR